MSDENETAADGEAVDRRDRQKKKKDKRVAIAVTAQLDIAKSQDSVAKAFAAGASVMRETVETLQEALKTERKHTAALTDQVVALISKQGEATEMGIIKALLDRDKPTVTPEVLMSGLDKLVTIAGPLAAIGATMLRKKYLPPTIGDAAEEGRADRRASLVRVMMAVAESESAQEAIRESIRKYHVAAGTPEPVKAAEGDWLRALQAVDSISDEAEMKDCQ